MSTAEVAAQLRSFGVKPSAQRIAVYHYLLENRIHPTADTIYRALSPLHPTLSRTTVYNTVRNLVAHRAVQPILIEDDEMRFDADVRIHAHTKCRVCGAVCDLFLDGSEQLPTLPDGFVAEETHLYYRGVCRNCQGKAE